MTPGALQPRKRTAAHNPVPPDACALLNHPRRAFCTAAKLEFWREVRARFLFLASNIHGERNFLGRVTAFLDVCDNVVTHFLVRQSC